MPEFNIINGKLLTHPVNWLIVWSVLLLAATAYAIVHDGMKNAAANHSIIPD